MSKALEPEDCLRGHQIIDTDSITAMLEREGFYYRPNRGGTSHLRYIHRDFPENALNVIAGTDKRDTQFHAAKAVLRVRALARDTAPVSPHDLWLRTVAGKIDSTREDFEVGETAITVRSHDYPMIGVEIGFDLTTEAAIGKLEQLGLMVHSVAAMVDRLGVEYGVETMTDNDGTFHLYQPQWRRALHFVPYAPAEWTHPVQTLADWENTLRGFKNVSDADRQLDEKAQKLRALMPDDEVLRTRHGIIIRDGEWPEIGMVVGLADSDAYTAEKHRGMKITAAAFAERIKKTIGVYEFNIERGGRTFYIDHQVYERIGGTVMRFKMNGDNDNAFAVLDRLEARTKTRDTQFRAAKGDNDAITIAAQDYSVREEDGLIIQEGKIKQYGSDHTMPLHLVTTQQGRHGLRHDAHLAHTLMETQMHDFDRVARSMGFRTSMRNGTLHLTHAFFDGMEFDMPEFEKTKKIIPTLIPLGERCAHSVNAESAVGEFIAAQEHCFKNFLNVFGKACNTLTEKIIAIEPEFRSLDQTLVSRFNYQRNVEQSHGQNYKLRYKLAGLRRGQGAAEFTVPAARIRNVQGIDVFVVTEKTVEALRTAVARQLPAPMWQSGNMSVVTPFSAVLSSPDATQQDIISALTAVGGPRMNGP